MSDNPIQHLLDQAAHSDRAGDVYTAVKLYKKAIRLAPEMPDPYARLGAIYKKRAEWKPAVYYSEQALAVQADHPSAWRTLGVAATALKQWKAARRAWNRLGYDFREIDQALDLDLGGIAVCLNPVARPAIVWAKRLDPARAQLLSVPLPSSGRHFGDLVLIDNEAHGRQVIGNTRLPVYPELQLIRKSLFHTFPVLLPGATLEHTDVLSRLCREAGLGFDNWSRANHLFLPPDRADFPEYHHLPGPGDPASYTVALAARHSKTVVKMLKTWSVITLQPFEILF